MSTVSHFDQSDFEDQMIRNDQAIWNNRLSREFQAECGKHGHVWTENKRVGRTGLWCDYCEIFKSDYEKQIQVSSNEV